jgi:mycofactocin radical SAM maturase
MYYDALRQGLAAPICLTWELTYACNLLCVHCLSSSGKRAPDELDTAEAKRLLDEWAAMKVFYINVGGGEPMTRPDFFELMEYSIEHGIGVKFSTNGTLLDRRAARWIASTDYLDVQISVDGASAGVNDPIRGEGSFSRARNAMELLAAEGFPFKVNHVVTRRSFQGLDELHAIVTGMGGQLRVTRLRPSGRGKAVWEALKLTQAQNRELYDWLRAHPDVLTGDSFFHLSALGQPLDGLNMCGAGRIVCCVDPRGDVYACPFVLAPEFKAGNVRDSSFGEVWQGSPLFERLRGWEVGGQCRSCGAYDRCHGGCMAVKHFTGVALDDPDPECVRKPEAGSTATLLPLALKPRAISPRPPAASRPVNSGLQP